MKQLIAGALLALTLTATSADAAVRIAFDPGGRIGDFITKYTELQSKSAKVVIDGMCISACTLVLGLLDEANVCATPRARLGFHSAHDGFGTFAKEATRLIWHMYPPHVRDILRARGWDGDGPNGEHPDLLYVEGDELHKMVRPCTAAELIS